MVARLLARSGADATICVMPEGPMTIPVLGEKHIRSELALFAASDSH
jgi:hypothetical protein